MKLPRFFKRQASSSDDGFDAAGLGLNLGARTHHYQFAHWMLPQMGFQESGHMLVSLTRSDASEFLKSLWQSVGNELPRQERLSPDGLSCLIRKFDDYAIAIITLPKAFRVTEAYYTAFTFGPVSTVPKGQLHSLPMRYFALEVGFSMPGEPSRTVFSEWTREPSHINMGDGPKPEVEAFFTKICELIGKSADVATEAVVCNSCAATFPSTVFSQEEYTLLQDYLTYTEFNAELPMLLKVKSLYERHPELIIQLQSDLEKLLESTDPEIQDKIYSGIPFDEIEVPVDKLTLPEGLSKDDEEAIEYLRTATFALEPRLQFVSENRARLEPIVERNFVLCPTCKTGHLILNPQ
ncbi:MAG: hypothetical protein JO316_24190 [Abitibacteriaceae bacterium]|nr:hypothetical protein [Abditibacteriaceae bacterium]MBV9868467.1 hypothetical protein [Abditibacteriaceae bacterium]